MDSADCIALIKPQFEVGKGEVGRGGIVTDRQKRRRVLKEITDAALGFGFYPVALIDSPILGAEGNREFLMHLKTGGDDRDNRAMTAFCLLPSAFCLLPSAFCLLPSAFCFLPSFCLLPSAFCFLLSAFCLLLSASAFWVYPLNLCRPRPDEID